MRVLTCVAIAAFAMAASFLTVGGAQAGGAVEVEADAGVITMVGTVEAIDETRQVVTVVGPHNNWVVVKVGPEHIKVIKVREKITISYQDEIAVAVRKVNKGQQGDGFEAEETKGMGLDDPTVAEQDWVEVTPHGASELSTIEITDTIKAINRNQRTITFAGTGGKTRTIKAGPNIDLTKLEAGDEVVLEVTRAVAVSVKPA